MWQSHIITSERPFGPAPLSFLQASPDGLPAETVKVGLLILILFVLLVQAVMMAPGIKACVELISSRLIDASYAARAPGRRVVRRVLANAAGIILSQALLLIISFFLPALQVEWTLMLVGW